MELTWNELLKNNRRVQEAFLRIAVGDELKMLSPFLEMVTLVAAAKSLKKETSYLFLSLCFATIGIDKEKHNLGFVGSYLNLLVDKVVNALLSEALFLKKRTLSHEMLLKKIVKAVFILSISAGAMLKLNMEKSEKGALGQLIYTKTLLGLVSSADVMKTTLKEFISVCDKNEKWGASSSEILSFISWLLISHVAMKDKKNFKALLEILGSEILGAIKKMEELLGQALSERRMKSEEISEIHSFVTACKIALENENYEDFTGAIEMALDATEIKKSGLEQDILEVELTTVNLFRAITRGNKEFSQNETQVSVVV